MNTKGFFITFEGGEGSGKTTQLRLIKDVLKKEGYNVLVTREPGGTPEAEKIRDLLVQRDGGNWSAEAETLLFYAARHMHCQNVIWPALKEKSIILCDRFTDSTRAYQCYAGKLSHKLVDNLNKKILNNFEPDLTFIFDIDAEKGLARSLKQNTSTQGKENTEDRFERKGIEFHKQIQEGFLDIAHKNTDRCRIIDAEQDIDKISQQIKRILLTTIGAKHE